MCAQIGCKVTKKLSFTVCFCGKNCDLYVVLCIYKVKNDRIECFFRVLQCLITCFGVVYEMVFLDALSVHLVLRTSFAVGFEVVGSNVDQSLSCFGCSPCNVGRDEGVGGFEQGVVGVGRFGRQHICRKCSYCMIAQCICHCFFVDYGSAACVDDYGCGLHRAQSFGIDHLFGRFVEWAVQAQYVALGE